MHSMHPGYTWKLVTSQKKLHACCKVCKCKMIFSWIPKPIKWGSFPFNQNKKMSCLSSLLHMNQNLVIFNKIYFCISPINGFIHHWHHRTHIYHSTLENKGAQIQSLRATDEPGFLCIHTENAFFFFLQGRHWFHLTSHAPWGKHFLHGRTANQAHLRTSRNGFGYPLWDPARCLEVMSDCEIKSINW